MKKRILLFLFLIVTIALIGADIKEEEKKLFKNKYMIPSSAEVFAALESFNQTDWKSVVFYLQKDDYKKRDSYKNTYIVALNAGIRITDGFLYIQAKDKKSFSENALVIKKHASGMGISQQLIKRTDKIRDYASKEDWKGLKKELDGLESSILDDISKINDKDTATLASMGAWLEGLHVISKVVNDNYDVDSSVTLRQPDLIDFFISEIAKMNPKAKEIDVVKDMERSLKELKKLCDVPPGKSISKENVGKMYNISRELIKDIEKSDL